uniref:Uncharacterized protein n=1 Tax=Anguilla anguilla TaxID=7936 RepID=A0A0E9WH00_ANGAN
MGKFNYRLQSQNYFRNYTVERFLKFDYSVFFHYSQYNLINTENIVIYTNI